MKIIQKCNKCKKKLFFSNQTICKICKLKKDEERKKKIEKKKISQNKKLKVEKKRKKEELANKKLLEELKKEKELNKVSKQKKQEIIITNQDIKKIKLDIQKIIIKNKPNKEKEAERLVQIDNTILFIQSSVKRLKVIEWRNGKKKILLNKEREIRHTHKGGWSQEKFQHFVDSKKKNTWDWVESNLTKKGVLRPPYNEIIIDCDNNNVKEKIETKINQLNSQ